MGVGVWTGEKSQVPGESHTSLYTYLQVIHVAFASSVLYMEENNSEPEVPEATFLCLFGLGSYLCELIKGK